MKARTSAQTLSLAFFCLTLLSSCAALRTPGEPVTLKEAVDASVLALETATQAAERNKTDWGLKPKEVTLTYHISDEQRRQGGANVQVGIEGASAGADVALAESTQRGNTIVMKFTRGGR